MPGPHGELRFYSSTCTDDDEIRLKKSIKVQFLAPVIAPRYAMFVPNDAFPAATTATDGY